MAIQAPKARTGDSWYRYHFPSVDPYDMDNPVASIQMHWMIPYDMSMAVWLFFFFAHPGDRRGLFDKAGWIATSTPTTHDSLRLFSLCINIFVIPFSMTNKELVTNPGWWAEWHGQWPRGTLNCWRSHDFFHSLWSVPTIRMEGSSWSRTPWSIARQAYTTYRKIWSLMVDPALHKTPHIWWWITTCWAA